MSIESLIEKNTETMERLIAVLEEGNADRAEVLEAAKAATAPKKAKAADTKVADTKVAEEADAVDAAKTGGITLDQIQQAMANYVGQHADEAERNARKAFAFEVIGKVGATKASEIAPDKFDIVLRTFNNLIEKNERKAASPAAAGDDLLG